MRIRSCRSIATEASKGADTSVSLHWSNSSRRGFHEPDAELPLLARADAPSHGTHRTAGSTVAAEVQRNWSLPTGKDLGRVFHDHYHSYGLLMDSFEYKTANALQKAS